MSLISRYERHLKERVEAGNLKEISKNTYLTSVSFILEALVGQIPVDVVQGYCEEWGAKTDYRTVIRDLSAMAKERSQHIDELRQERQEN